MTDLLLRGADVGQTGAVDAPAAPARTPAGRLGRPLSALRAVPHVGTWAGVLLCAAGLVLIAVAWGGAAGTLQVGRQMPYVISAGCTGLALVAIGLTVANLSAKAEDARARSDQAEELAQLLAEIRRAVEESS
jgi:hypothetical protein